EGQLAAGSVIVAAPFEDVKNQLKPIDRRYGIQAEDVTVVSNIKVARCAVKMAGTVECYSARSPAIPEPFKGMEHRLVPNPVGARCQLIDGAKTACAPGLCRPEQGPLAIEDDTVGLASIRLVELMDYAFDPASV